MSDTDMNAEPFAQDENPAPAYGQARDDKPGVHLARQRQALGWSVDQVADQLKFAPRQVIALEADDYAALPALAVVRGFIRAYAKILKIDAAPLVAMIEVQTSAPEAPTALRSDLSSKFNHSTSAPLMSKRSHPYAWGAAIVAALLVIGVGSQRMGWLPPGGVWTRGTAPALAPVTPMASEPVTTLDAGATGSTSAALPAPELATGATSTTDLKAGAAAPATTTTLAHGAPAPAVAPGAAAPAPAAALSGPITGAPPAPAAAVTPAPTPAPAAAAATTAANTGVLAFNVHQDTWVEVRRANGSVALSRLLKAGTTESVNLDGTSQLVVGNIAGVDVTLRGAPLPLKSPSGGNTVRMTVK